jgi:hypothetical protein
MKRFIYASLLSIAAFAGTIAVASACPAGSTSCWVCVDDGCTVAIKMCCTSG